MHITNQMKEFFSNMTLVMFELMDNDSSLMHFTTLMLEIDNSDNDLESKLSLYAFLKKVLLQNGYLKLVTELDLHTLGVYNILLGDNIPTLVELVERGNHESYN